MRNANRILFGISEGKKPSEDQDLDGKMLDGILGKGCNWLRIGTSGGL
jgi:hypothetical protein